MLDQLDIRTPALPADSNLPTADAVNPDLRQPAAAVPDSNLPAEAIDAVLPDFNLPDLPDSSVSKVFSNVTTTSIRGRGWSLACSGVIGKTGQNFVIYLQYRNGAHILTGNHAAVV